MRDIRKCKHYKLDTDENGYISVPNGQTYKIQNNDVLIFPISLNKEVLLTNYKRLKYLISNKIIFNDGGKSKVSFEVKKLRNLTYSEWEVLIDFAKQAGINFRMNHRLEYNAFELENYLKKYITNKNGKKEFIFEMELPLSKNNPLLENRNNEEDILKNKKDYVTFKINGKKKDLDNYLSFVENEYYSGITFELAPSQRFDDNTKQRIMQLIDYIRKKYRNDIFKISFSNCCQYYGGEEFENLLEVEKYIKENYDKNYELFFCGDGKEFSKTQIISVNNKIESVAKELEKSNFSPYEKIMYVHKLLTELEYVTCNDNPDVSRNLYSSLSTRNIICVGYAAIFNAIFNELNDENIKTRIDTIAICNKDAKKIEYHALNCVYIKDEKYGIEGYYNIDSCVNNKENALRSFMVPTVDVEHSYFNGGSVTYKVPLYSKGNTNNGTIPFTLNNGEGYEYKLGAYERVVFKDLLESTRSFLDTNMGNDNRKKLKIKTIAKEKDAIKVINECVKNSKPIPISCTQKVIEKIVAHLYDFNEDKSKECASKILARSYFDSIFFCDRNECQNNFAKESIKLEKEEVKLDKKIRPLR